MSEWSEVKCQTTCLSDLETSRDSDRQVRWALPRHVTEPVTLLADETLRSSRHVVNYAPLLAAVPLHFSRLFDLSPCFTLLPTDRAYY